MTSQTERAVRNVVSGVVGLDLSRVRAGADLVAEIGLDSLQGLRVIAAIEKRFGVRFPDEHLGEFRTLRQLVDAIENDIQRRDQCASD